MPEKGNVFVSADYSQFELRLAAVLSGDEKMINDFNAGTDIHAKTASEVYHVPLDNVTKDQRRAAKVVNFGVLYGMSQHGLAAAAGMTYVDAQKFIDEYFRVRPNIRKYIDETIKKRTMMDLWRRCLGGGAGHLMSSRVILLFVLRRSGLRLICRYRVLRLIL